MKRIYLLPLLLLSGCSQPTTTTTTAPTPATPKTTSEQPATTSKQNPKPASPKTDAKAAQVQPKSPQPQAKMGRPRPTGMPSFTPEPIIKTAIVPFQKGEPVTAYTQKALQNVLDTKTAAGLRSLNLQYMEEARKLDAQAKSPSTKSGSNQQLYLTGATFITQQLSALASFRAGYLDGRTSKEIYTKTIQQMRTLLSDKAKTTETARIAAR